MISYKRFFENSNIISIPTTNLTYSNYFPNSMYHALNSNLILDDDYILCPLYRNGDFQVGITGGVKINEKFEDAALRECGEEVGLIPKVLKTIEYGSVGNKKITVYVCDIKNSEAVSEQFHWKKNENEEKDSNDKKIGVIIYGCKDKILEYMKNDKIYRYYSSDAIVGIVCVKVGRIRKKLKK
jgi:8-oxo-dGTP pyrophosphatase MutT (NUDIX family)